MVRLAELEEGIRLYLPNTLAREAISLADELKCLPLVSIDPEPCFHDLGVTVREPAVERDEDDNNKPFSSCIFK